MSTPVSTPSPRVERIGNATLYLGDALEVLRTLPDSSVRCCVTSPPYYGLRDYGVRGQIGLEKTPEQYIGKMVEVFREVRRVLTDDATLWLNIGDSYAGRWGAQSRGSFTPGTLEGANSKEYQLSARQIRAHPKGTQTGSLKNTPGCKAKDLIGIPWMLAFALRADGWYLRQDIIWSKPNPMPESVTDRCTKAHEYVFMLSKSRRYYYDATAISEPFADKRQGNPGTYQRTTQKAKGANNNRADLGFLNNGAGWNAQGENTSRNRRTVWSVPVSPYAGAHFATFPPQLIEPCIKAGSAIGDVVLDPFGGAGTTSLVCERLQRRSIYIDLNLDYLKMAAERIRKDAPLFAEVSA